MKIKYIIITVLLIITGSLVKSLEYDTYNAPESGQKAISGIPIQFSVWQGRDVPLEEQIFEFLETRSIIHRNYRSTSKENVFLSIVYYTATKVDFHRPESCLAGQGIQIDKTSKKITFLHEKQEVEITINQLNRKEGDNDMLVYYVYKAGDFLGDNYLKLRFNLLVNKFVNTKKSGSLIRLSTPIISGDETKASAVLVDFFQDLYPYILKNL